jgi:hypothetical protein
MERRGGNDQQEHDKAARDTRACDQVGWHVAQESNPLAKMVSDAGPSLPNACENWVRGRNDALSIAPFSDGNASAVNSK